MGESCCCEGEKAERSEHSRTRKREDQMAMQGPFEREREKRYKGEREFGRTVRERREGETASWFSRECSSVRVRTERKGESNGREWRRGC